RLAARLIQSVGQLRAAIGGIDGHEDQAGLGACELRDDPFRAVLSPNAEAIARLKSEAKEGCCGIVDALLELRVCPPHCLVTDNEGFPFSKTSGNPVEICADRLADQRCS